LKRQSDFNSAIEYSRNARVHVLYVGTKWPVAGLPLVLSAKEGTLADKNGGVGVIGVLVGALLVLVIGGGLLFATGNLGNKGGGNSLKVELPKSK
jgi:hypothetical protein